jgi:hypothetical protein
MGRTKELYEQMMLQDTTNEFIVNKSFFYETLNIPECDVC